MRDQSSQWVAWSTMCWRTSQSKISAPPPVSESSPASISSSRISSAGSPEIFSNQWISVAVKHFSDTLGQRRLQLAQHPRVVLPRQRRVQAVDDVQLGELLVLHLLGLGAPPPRPASCTRPSRPACAGTSSTRRTALHTFVRLRCRLTLNITRSPLSSVRRWWASRPSQARSSHGVQGLAVGPGQPLPGVHLRLDLALPARVRHTPPPFDSAGVQPRLAWPERTSRRIPRPGRRAVRSRVTQ